MLGKLEKLKELSKTAKFHGGLMAALVNW